MSDLKRISALAIVFLVLLRISIGWQFLYEGLWKYNTLGTAQPWSSEGYLKNAQGPFRDHFRRMTGDPDDLQWLDYDAVSAKWDHWRERFAAHYGLSEAQRRELDEKLDAPPVKTAPLPNVPETVTFLDPRTPADQALARLVTHDPQRRLLSIAGDTPLLPGEIAALKGMVPVVRVGSQYARADGGTPLRDDDGRLVAPQQDDLDYYRAIERLEALSSRLSYRQKLAAALRGDPDRVGVVGRLTEQGTYRTEMGTVRRQAEGEHNIRYGEIQVYKDLLADYDAAHRGARIDYQREHLERLWQKIQDKRVELVGPVKALDADLKREALLLLTAAQRALGPVPPERTQLWWVDRTTIWGLIVVGVLLIVGLGTRLAALAGAAMLVLFYLPFPPWPGVPQAPGPEHSLYVNKNLIEAVALLAIAALPTGLWFGLAGLIRWICAGRGARR